MEPAVPVSAIDMRLAEIRSAIHDLEIEREMLARLRQSAVVPVHLNGQSEPLPVSVGPKKVSTAHAIYGVVSRHPGLRPAGVVELALPILDTSSGHPRRLLFSAISSLKKKGRFRVDDEGGLYLKKSGEGAEGARPPGRVQPGRGGGGGGWNPRYIC